MGCDYYLSGTTITDEDKFEGGNVLSCRHYVCFETMRMKDAVMERRMRGIFNENVDKKWLMVRRVESKGSTQKEGATI